MIASCVIGLHLATYHFDRQAPYREFNPGLIASCDGYTVGALKNSAGRTSVHAGYTWESGRVSVTAGAITGYGKLAPLLIASVEVADGWRAGLFPKHGRKSGGIHLLKMF